MIFAEYAMDVADACHASGIKTVAVTAGYIGTEARREFYAKMDAANVDLKGFTDDFYVKLCGAHLQPVLDTLVYLKHETDVWFEITTLLIPGKNDSSEEIEAECKWIMRELGPDVPLHFTAFHPDYKMTDLPPTPAATLTRARDIALREGLRYVYTGNVHDRTGGTTFCPGCGKPVIVRDWHEILRYAVTADGRCDHCGRRCRDASSTSTGDWAGAGCRCAWRWVREGSQTSRRHSRESGNPVTLLTVERHWVPACAGTTKRYATPSRGISSPFPSPSRPGTSRG